MGKPGLPPSRGRGGQRLLRGPGEWLRLISPAHLSLCACCLSVVPSFRLPRKLCADRLHLAEADPAAVSAADHGHPGSPALSGRGHQPGGEVRGLAKCLCWGPGCHTSRGHMGLGPSPLLGGPAGPAVAEVTVPARSPRLRVSGGGSRAWAPPTAWLCPERWRGLVWPGGQVGVVRLGQAGPQGQGGGVTVSGQLATSSAAALPTGFTSAGSATSSSRASAASSRARRA